MKDTDSQKLDQIITMLGDVVDIFGKRFDKSDDTIAGVEKRLTDRIDSVKVKVSGIQSHLDAETLKRVDQKPPERVARLKKPIGLDKKVAA